MIPDDVWTHLGAWFLGVTMILGIGFFASLSNRVRFLEAENAELRARLDGVAVGLEEISENLR